MTSISIEFRPEHLNMKRYSFVPPGGGQGYDWSRDHTFVKVSTVDSAGAFALMEDNLKLGAWSRPATLSRSSKAGRQYGHGKA